MSLITVTQASARSGLTVAHLRHLLAAGTIKGQKLGNAWVLQETALQRFLNAPRKRGPKPRKQLKKRG